MISILLQDRAVILLPEPPKQPWTTIEYAEAAVIVILVLWAVAIAVRPRVAIKNWHHRFDGLSFEADDFFKQVIAEVQARAIPFAFFEYALYFEAGVFTPRRKYLSIAYKNFIIDICCIAHGSGQYVSWWLGDPGPGLIASIPILKDIFGKNPLYQSYYQIDTATLFQTGVHDSVLAVIDRMSEEKGIRKLTELERQPKYGRT